MEMTYVETERNIFKFYGIMSFLAILNCGIGVMGVYEFLPANNVTGASDYSLLVIGCLCFTGAVYTVIRFFKNAPIITVDKNVITFNDDGYFWSEVAQIHLMGKQPYKYFLDYTKDGAKLTFKDGTVKYFYDDLYSNTWEVKSFIQQVVINKEKSDRIEILEVEPNDLQFENFETFKGKQFFSMQGLYLWGMIAFIVFMLVKNWSRQPTYIFIFVGLMIIIWFGIISYSMHYFELSDKYLVVKNHNLFWIKKIYRIDNIERITFESPGKMPNSLRIITKDFRNKLYPAGTLRKDTWLDLKNKLELKGITVRNYCIYQ